MPRGGKRKGSGRKSTWKSGCKFEDTKLIRVPKAIADELLNIAHKLDSGETLDLVTKPKGQLSLLGESSLEIIKDNLLNGVELAKRLGVSSAAFTPVLKKGEEAFKKYTVERDPDSIAWKREGRKYKPILD
jgi:hypothetical protein